MATIDAVLHSPGPFGYCFTCEDRCTGPGMPRSHYRAHPEPVEPYASPPQQTGLVVSSPAAAFLNSRAGLSSDVLEKFKDTLLTSPGLAVWMNQSGIANLRELHDRIPNVGIGFLRWVLGFRLPPAEAFAQDGSTEDEFLDAIAYGLGIGEEDVVAQWSSGIQDAARYRDDTDPDEWEPRWDSSDDNDSPPEDAGGQMRLL